MFTSTITPASLKAATLGTTSGLLVDTVSPVLCCPLAAAVVGLSYIGTVTVAQPEASNTPVRAGASIDELLASA